MEIQQKPLIIETVIFDLGGVLIDWNPRHLYRKLFKDDVEAMERFLMEVCSTEWNEKQDAGRSWDEAINEAILRHPTQEKLIKAYREKWHEMIPRALEKTVIILDELRTTGVKILALTNWSHDTFPIALERFKFLSWFDGVIVSGTEGLKKPDPAIFALLISRYKLDPSRAVFIDDSEKNVASAHAAGLLALRFTDSQKLRSDLINLGFPLKARSN
jgi:2-haloacid dehalogenase